MTTLRHFLPLFLLLLAAPSLLHTQPTEPILTLNTEMHTAIIKRISTDGRGRYLLTCSDDKTAKLWDINTGTLLHTFRPPIGAGHEGKLFAGALSPDGHTVAVGGWTSEGGLNNNVYLFDAASGTMLYRIEALPNIINDLEFSPDGRYLAAALLGANGIRVWRTTDYALQAQDTDYKADSYNIAFDAWGRLASACFDGYLRLYDAKFKLLKKTATTGGNQPFSLSFSPDARLLAVAYSDSPTVQVLDANTLTLRYTPNVAGANSIKNRLDKVSFSNDGSYLAAGGFSKLYKDGQWWFQMHVWSQMGKGDYVDYSADNNGIQDIKPLPDGHFAFGGGKPDWGVIEPVGGQHQYTGSEINDYSAGDRSHLRLGSGGTEVGITPLGKLALQFTIPGRQLVETASSHPAYIATQNGLAVTDWNDNTAPKLNGKAFSFLSQYEYCESVDIATGGQGIVLGTQWNLYCTDAAGQQRWKTPVQDMATCVNIDAYNQVVAAALGDGTIRWYRFRDGEPLLSLYLHPDNKRWVLWTPSGYYDAAPGSEDLIGWHVNNGPDKAASYYPASRFRDTYYRPDVIDLILETLDEAKALSRANEAKGQGSVAQIRSIADELPPTVRILSPGPDTVVSTTTLTVGYAIESPNDEPITKVRLQVDGRPVAIERGFKKGQKSTITLPSADCVVSVIAENRFGASEPATVRVKWRGATATQASAGVDIRPSLYVLAIGVSKYEKVPKLDFAAKDATDFATAAAKLEGLLYRNVQVKILTDANATKDNVLDGFDWLQKATTSRDVAMLFFAGHGMDDNAQNFFFLPVGADPDALRRTCLSDSDVQSTVASVPGKIIVFMDACHSGGLMTPINPNRRDPLPPDVIKIVNELISAENGGVVFCSATSRQYALEDKIWNNGAFTKAVVEGLSGKAKTPGSDKITLKTLDAYVAERVKELTGGKQSPTTVYSVNVPDFPIGIVK